MKKNEGYLVINSFLKSEKFSRLYQSLVASFQKQGMILHVVKAIDFDTCLQNPMVDVPSFAIFWDKDIYLAKRMEQNGIRLFNSSDSIEVCDNKILTYQILAKANLRVPKTYIVPKTFDGIGYNDLSFLNKVETYIPYPFIIKEAYGSYGKEVYLANNNEKAEAIIRSLSSKDFLIQEFISSSYGTDIRVNVCGDQEIVSIKRENKNDFRSNISNGGTASKISTKDSYRSIAIKACQALNLDFAGVDLLIGENEEPLICEVNSNPQYLSTFDATGIDLGDSIASHVKKEMKL